MTCSDKLARERGRLETIVRALVKKWNSARFDEIFKRDFDGAMERYRQTVEQVFDGLEKRKSHDRHQGKNI